MVRRTARSLAVLVVSALAGSLVLFVGLRLLSGDVTSVMLGPTASPETVARLRTELGLDRPWPVQYFDWIAGLVQGDLGESFVRRYDIFDQIRARMGLTLSLALATLTLSSVVSLIAGTYAAMHPRTRRGALVNGGAQFGLAVPPFWIGLLLIGLVSLRMGWLPAGGYIRWTEDPQGAIRTLTLPVLTLSISLIAVFTRHVRAAMLDVLSADYIRTALSKGRTLRAAVAVHGLRNASVPLVTVATLAFGGLLTGVVVVEVVFALPGLGRLLLDAVNAREVVVVQSLVFFFLLIILALNFLMDVAYGLLDPRVRDVESRG